MTQYIQQISVYTDDASGSSSALDSGETAYAVTTQNAPLGISFGTFYFAGFRFTAIPEGSIDSAYLTFIAD